MINRCNICRNMVFTSRGWECIYANGSNRVLKILSNPGGFCILKRGYKK